MYVALAALVGAALGFAHSWRKTRPAHRSIEAIRLDRDKALLDAKSPEDVKFTREAAAQAIGRVTGLRLGAGFLFAAIGAVAAGVVTSVAILIF